MDLFIYIYNIYMDIYTHTHTYILHEYLYACDICYRTILGACTVLLP